MLKANDIAKIQTALDTLAAIPSAQLATSGAATLPLLDLYISVGYRAPHNVTAFSGRGGRCGVGTKRVPGHYEAECEIDSLDVSATGATRAAALRNLFKAIRNAASLNAPTLRVPLVLCEPTKAKAQARAERKANADRAWQIALDRAVTAVEAEREAAPTIIVPADAAPGSEGIFKALLGLRTEQKIVALVNALHAAGVTIHRLDEDGEPIIRAVLPNALGTCTVLNL